MPLDLDLARNRDSDMKAGRQPPKWISGLARGCGTSTPLSIPVQPARHSPVGEGPLPGGKDITVVQTGE